MAGVRTLPNTNETEQSYQCSKSCRTKGIVQFCRPCELEKTEQDLENVWFGLFVRLAISAQPTEVITDRNLKFAEVTDNV